ncbi:hypothetical protein D3C78_1780270 [compost metagenome]
MTIAMLLQQTSGADDQVLLIRHAGHRGQQVNGVILAHVDGQRVAVIQKLEQRLQQVVAVFTLAGNVQKQTEFSARWPLTNH